MDYSGIIACIGWGSLVWKPGGLPVVGGWNLDGPSLPVEFAREPGGKRITLVICPGLPAVQTCWSLMDVPDVSIARQHLGQREHPAASSKWIEDNIGYWDRAANVSHGMEGSVISMWAERLRLAGIVWTSLPFKFAGNPLVMPTEDEVIDYLRNLESSEREDAETYVRKTPKQIDTQYRRRIERELGWSREA
ncbi:hypothetical protein [Cupriavidus sp. 8B]